LVLVGEAQQAETARIEVCHEALITQWPWLQNTLNAAAADLRALDRLMDRAARWSGAPQAERDKHLATGAERELFAELCDRRDDWFSAMEREFVGASNMAFARDEKAKRDAEDNRQAAARRLRVLASMLGAAVVGLLVFVVIAIYYANVARDREAVAQTNEARALRNQSAALAAISNVALSTNPTRAVKLALAAWPRRFEDLISKLDVALASLSAAVVQSTERRVFRGHGHIVNRAAFSPDGTRVVTASSDDTARLWDVATAKEIAVLRGHNDHVYSAAFSPDGTRVVTASGDMTARLWDVATAKEIAALRGVGSAAF
jgi:hypothetical protein